MCQALYKALRIQRRSGPSPCQQGAHSLVGETVHSFRKSTEHLGGRQGRRHQRSKGKPARLHPWPPRSLSGAEDRNGAAVRIQGDECSAGDGQLPYGVGVGGEGMGVHLVCERGSKGAAEGSTTPTSKDAETPRAARPGERERNGAQSSRAWPASQQEPWAHRAQAMFPSSRHRMALACAGAALPAAAGTARR